MKNLTLFSLFGVLLTLSNTVYSQESAEDLAKKLANPISSLISLPFQNNTDFGIGENQATKNTLNIQPVIPIGISENINLITRVILPVVSLYNMSGIGNQETGLADAVVSAFISPANSKNGLTWGVGPVLLLPIGTEDILTSKKFGVGPTAVALYQVKGFTIGALANQIFSVAGEESRPDVSTLFFQPFFTYNWKSGAGLGGNFEVTQNWEADNTTIWFNPTISAVTSLGKQKTQFAIGPKLNLMAPEGAKAALGIRTAIVFLFPK